MCDVYKRRQLSHTDVCLCDACKFIIYLHVIWPFLVRQAMVWHSRPHTQTSMRFFLVSVLLFICLFSFEFLYVGQLYAAARIADQRVSAEVSSGASYLLASRAQFLQQMNSTPSPKICFLESKYLWISLKSLCHDLMADVSFLLRQNQMLDRHDTDAVTRRRRGAGGESVEESSSSAKGMANIRLHKSPCQNAAMLSGVQTSCCNSLVKGEILLLCYRHCEHSCARKRESLCSTMMRSFLLHLKSAAWSENSSSVGQDVCKKMSTRRNFKLLCHL